MFYVCIERKNRERTVASSATSKIKLDRTLQALIIEGPRNAVTEYTSEFDSAFFTESDEIAINFLLRRPIDTSKIRDKIFTPKWEERKQR
jgi:hypothetical protein